jgi:hypothetical protein
MKPFKQFKEEMGVGAAAPTNSAGGGQIAGIGIGPKGEPGVPGKVLRRKKLNVDKISESSTFMGHKVFEVDFDTFHKSKFGKKKFARWNKSVGDNPEAAEYGKKTRKPMIVADKNTGAMVFFRHPKDKSRPKF